MEIDYLNYRDANPNQVSFTKLLRFPDNGPDIPGVEAAALVTR